MFYHVLACPTADNDAKPVGSYNEADRQCGELIWFVIFGPALVFYLMRLKFFRNKKNPLSKDPRIKYLLEVACQTLMLQNPRE